MWVSSLKNHHFYKIKQYKGEKTLEEIKIMFGLKNKGNRSLREALIRNNVAFKKGNVDATTTIQHPPVNIEVGKYYKLTSLRSRKGMEIAVSYEGKIITEYERFYLGIDPKGIKFTIQKYPDEWEIKKI